MRGMKKLESSEKTRTSSCVNARGIPPAAYQILHLLPNLGGGVPTLAGGYLPWPGGTYPRWGYLPWPGVPPARVGTPGCGQTDACENSTFPILRIRAVNTRFCLINFQFFCGEDMEDVNRENIPRITGVHASKFDWNTAIIKYTLPFADPLNLPRAITLSKSYPLTNNCNVIVIVIDFLNSDTVFQKSNELVSGLNTASNRTTSH